MEQISIKDFKEKVKELIKNKGSAQQKRYETTKERNSEKKQQQG